MRRMLIAALAGALVALAVGVLTGAGAVGTDDDNTVTETTTETVEAPKQEDKGQDEREAGEDISGPCDEAEHANDPRCTGTPPTGGAPVDDDDDVAGDDDDVPAPGPAPTPRVDNSGPGSMNSGPGSVNSGRDDDADDEIEDEDDDEIEDEDHSGPGHDGSDDHGGDDDNSGPGGGDDD